MMGLHPSSVDEKWEDEIELVKSEIKSGNYIGVGEIGMDLFWSKEFIEEQKMAFRAQVEIAKDAKLPIVIHARDSFDEIFEIIDELNNDDLTGIFHCFTGNINQANKIINYGGFKMGLGGVLTYKNAGLAEVIAEIDLEHLVLETDSPYLTPVPHRGKRNESAYVVHVAEKLSDIKSVPLSTVEEITTKNAMKIFKLPQNQ
jgi:TatD DNase family protein